MPKAKKKREKNLHFNLPKIQYQYWISIMSWSSFNDGDDLNRWWERYLDLVSIKVNVYV